MLAPLKLPVPFHHGKRGSLFELRIFHLSAFTPICRIKGSTYRPLIGTPRRVIRGLYEYVNDSRFCYSPRIVLSHSKELARHNTAQCIRVTTTSNFLGETKDFHPISRPLCTSCASSALKNSTPSLLTLSNAATNMALKSPHSLRGRAQFHAQRLWS